MIALAALGVEHSMRLSGLITWLADTSAQTRVRLTVLLVAGLALAAQLLGFEAILSAFLAGLLVRALDPSPEITHPLYPMKLEAVGYGLLVPVFFVTSGLTPPPARRRVCSTPPPSALGWSPLAWSRCWSSPPWR